MGAPREGSELDVVVDVGEEGTGIEFAVPFDLDAVGFQDREHLITHELHRYLLVPPLLAFGQQLLVLVAIDQLIQCGTVGDLHVAVVDQMLGITGVVVHIAAVAAVGAEIVTDVPIAAVGATGEPLQGQDAGLVEGFEGGVQRRLGLLAEPGLLFSACCHHGFEGFGEDAIGQRELLFDLLDEIGRVGEPQDHLPPRSNHQVGLGSDIEAEGGG